ncbi:MAG: 4Fe-4S dicluster domain-containing protein [Tannerellaceae bacterium]|nr:4Fe-4S dicluster domain-containing protein [Tannerellaceae bacterium]
MNIVYMGLGMALLLWIGLGLRQRQRRRLRIICVRKEQCRGCGRCLKQCSRRVLEATFGEAGGPVVVKYPHRCTACGNCLKRCRFDALQFIDREAYGDETNR